MLYTFSLSVLFSLLLLSGLAGCVAQSAPPASEPTDSSTPLPETEGSKLVETHCLGCHLVEKLHQYRKTPDQWEKALQKMISNYGVDLTDKEKAVLIEYLAEENKKE